MIRGRALPPHWPPHLAHPSPPRPQASAVVQYTAEEREATRNKKPDRMPPAGFQYLERRTERVKPLEQVRIMARRTAKAERDERIDLTLLMTPPKQYMAGFTRPKDLRNSNWFPGGAYILREKSYLAPSTDAYQPHTAFILESRYNILYGVGRVETPEYIYGVCREQDLPAVLRDYNSHRAGGAALEAMDSARWPEGPQLNPHKKQRWWIDKADLEETLNEIQLNPAPSGENHNDGNGKKQSKERYKRVTALNPKPIRDKATLIPDDIPASLSVRLFHSSSVPLNANKRVRQLQDSPSLMEPISDAVLSDQIEASTHPRDSKIPPEDADGVRLHPSGFVATPTQETRSDRYRDPARETAAVAGRVSEEKDLEDVTAETATQKGKVPYEVRGSDGMVTHHSVRFDSPTSADEFAHSGNSTVNSQQPTNLPGSKRGFHTTLSPRGRAATATLDAEEVTDAEEEESDSAQVKGRQFLTRKEYFPRLKTEPFWRPLMTVTVPTRPLALALIRLVKSQTTGRPFHADIDNHDKKSRISLTHRMRAMRLHRIQDITVQMAQLLAGMRGGLVGLRFSPAQLGRGVGGEGLADPIPEDKRVIQVGVGNWYRLADDMKELVRARGVEEVLAPEPFNVYGLDEFGHRLNERGEVVPWREHPSILADIVSQDWYREFRTLRWWLDRFERHAQLTTGFEGPRDASSRRRETAWKVLQTPNKQAAEDEDEDEDEDEQEFGDEEIEDEGSDPTQPPELPTVLMRPSKDLTVSVMLQRHELSYRPIDFVLLSPKGQPILGPHDEKTTEISTEGFTEKLSPRLGRQMLQGRCDMLYSLHSSEIAQAWSARHRAVDYPKTVLHNIVWAPTL
ncbi:hypothetical protein C8R46DRAFT_279267 [Mycena filopes]|nr:hypothetical protein C8R46DRAFT_279267 [Mycena filopes]